jgi:multiple sugar transport system ATP-binding protein
MATIELEKLVKRYGKVEAVRAIDLQIKDGEFVVFVGPSGCGKSTTLRMIAGLEDISGGHLKIGGEVVNERDPKQRNIAMVFQNYAIYPHMTVRQNIGFGLYTSKLSKAEKDKRIEETGKALGLEPYLDRRPAHCPAGSASASPSVAPWCATRRPSFSMSRCRTSMPSFAHRCALKSRACISVLRRRPFM